MNITVRFISAIAALMMCSTLALAQNNSIFTATYTTGFIDLDPSTAASSEIAVLANVYEPLVWWQPGENGSDATLEPGLATSWEASEDGLSWTFKLREGVTFHDGTPFTSEAVKFSIERTQRLEGASAWIWWAVESIETPDPLTAVFKLTDPSPIPLIASSAYCAWMISPMVGDKTGEWFNAGNAAGTGPFTVRSYKAGVQTILERHADYWGESPEGGIDIAVIDNVEDPVLREQRLLGGKSDWSEGLDTDNLAQIDENENVRIANFKAFQNFFGMYNVAKPPLDNIKVRQALSYAFPYDQMVNNIMSGQVTQARGIVPVGMPGHAADAMQFTQDIEKAKALLSDAGVEQDSLKLTITYTAGSPEPQKAAEIYKAALAQIGVELVLQPMAWEAQYELATSDPANAQDIFMMFWWPTYVTSLDFLSSLFRSEDDINYNLSYYKNADFDALVDKGADTMATDSASSVQAFEEASRLLAADAPAVFIYDQQNAYGVREDIKGYISNPAYSHVVFLNQISR